MKKFVVLTENELSQVSGGVEAKEVLRNSLIDKSVGSLMLITAPLMRELGESLVNLIIGKPKKEEEKESKEVAQAA